MTTPSEDFWEQHYRSADHDHGHDDDVHGPGRGPNEVLVATVADLPPGRAVDLGCGYGGDALWLAARGWRVTAVDVSATALARAATAAAAAGLELRTERHDLSVSLPAVTGDLVTACYVHTPVDVDREAMLRRGGQLVAPGGRLVVVEHASTAPWMSSDADTVWPTPEQTRDAIGLVGWVSERCERVRRTVTGPGGVTAEVTENLLVLRRP